MRIKSIRKRKLNPPEKVYDVINAAPYNNFLVKAGGEFLVSHNCGILDEVDFVQGANPRLNQAKIMKIYRGVKRRMESRYMKLGEQPGILFVVSSKRSENDFLEQYVKEVQDSPHVYIVDEPLWKVKPSSNYSGKTFKVAVGNKHVRSKIISQDEDPDTYEKQGYQILDVPVEHKHAFDLHVEDALMDIAGISSTSFSKFFSYEQLEKCYSEGRKNPFMGNILTIGLADSHKIEDYFLPDLIEEKFKSTYNFIHIDTSLRVDITGISMIAVGGTKKVSKYSQGELTEEIDVTYTHLFTVGIQSPADSEISFAKTRDFIYYLKSLGFNISGVSVDGYQSADTFQILSQAGYKSNLISVDIKPDPYFTLRSAIAEERIHLIKIEELEKELLDLERDNMTGKIDHPVNSSKDLADSLCGSIYNASLFKLLPHLKYASSDAQTATSLFTDKERARDMMEKNLVGLDPETKTVESIEELIRESDSDVIDW